MNTPRPCGCKGKRSCLICEEDYSIQPPAATSLSDIIYDYCHQCGEAWTCPGENLSVEVQHPQHSGSSIPFPGVYIQQNFLSESEKQQLLDGINNEPWSLSQSGRRKQNYGPRCNFKKMKIQKRDFNGFPKFSKFVHEKFQDVPILNNYKVIEQCVLEYDPNRGASIDPHIDDCWIWGERIVTVNVLGDTFLTFTKYSGDRQRYNLNYLDTYSSDLIHKLDGNDKYASEVNCEDGFKVRVFMPEKSLIVLFGSARYEWEHFIPREDIKSYRLCVAYREFSPPYLNGDFRDIGNEIQEIGQQFW
ncbi:UNVERIFIED_CONTAM: hypothetical protein PYX00_005517 [Menopon gallinae]|uniref:Uncharacterized protein n=1 Tax=Menopon gallinae TaxID=328185 RepID=A0AAW2HRQ5_9NEOP